MSRKSTGIFLSVVLLFVVLVAVAYYFSGPKTPDDFLRRARTVESQNSAKIQGFRAAGDEQSKAKAADLLAQTLSEYAEVAQRFPGSMEAEEADYRMLKLKDEVATSPIRRLEGIKKFLEKHTTSTREADLRWAAAEIIQKEYKRPLEAISAFEEFARKFPKDERAADAQFRVANIYEEIKEFPKAAEAYKKVVEEYPSSKYADEAQFRVGTMLAEKMEKKQEAEKELAKLQEKFPKSRFATAAAGQRKKLAEETATQEGEKYKEDYYGGMREIDPLKEAAGGDTRGPEMQKMRDLRVDIIHEDITLDLRREDPALSATAVVYFKPLEKPVDELMLRLSEKIKVETISSGGNQLKFKRSGSFITISLSETVHPDTTSTVLVSYKAKQSDESTMDRITSVSMALLGERMMPTGAFGERCTAQITVSVPENLTAVSQGTLLTSETLPSGNTFTYRHDNPVFYYAVAAGKYNRHTGAYTGSKTIPLELLFFRETDEEFFKGYLDELPLILAFFESRLGPYPYDKLSIAQINGFPGGIGTPDLLLMGEAAFKKKGVPAAFLAHEVSHQWFGNALGVDLTSGSIPWLAEGFATYWDALYLEQKSGHEQFIRHLRTTAANYYGAISVQRDQPIDQVAFEDPMYVPLSYDKGAFVLHALRGLIGDDAFFRSMKKYVEELVDGTATTARFREIVERESGKQLDWFFEEWLHRTGIPRYRLNVARETASLKGKYEVYYELEQVDRLSSMPLELELELRNGKERKRIETPDILTTGTFTTDSEPLKLIVDPDYWILKHPRVEDWTKNITK